ncbi:MAG: hypothetical protein U1E90_05995 [Burkholderiaceae bacterium]
MTFTATAQSMSEIAVTATITAQLSLLDPAGDLAVHGRRHSRQPG